MSTLSIATAGLLSPAGSGGGTILPTTPGRKPWGLLPESTLVAMLTTRAKAGGTLRTVLINGAHTIPADFRMAADNPVNFGMELSSSKPTCIVTSGQFCDLGITTGTVLQTDGRTYYVIADDPLPSGFCRLTLSEDNPL